MKLKNKYCFGGLYVIYYKKTKGRYIPMNKSELVAAIAEKAGVSKKDTEAMLKAFVETNAQGIC